MLNYTINSRSYSVTVDQFGVDPLLDKTVGLIINIPTYYLYEVKQQQRGRPDSIAYDVYSESNYWWVLMYYNAIFNFREIKEGLSLRIPERSSITRILADQASRSYGMNVRTISI